MLGGTYLAIPISRELSWALLYVISSTANVYTLDCLLISLKIMQGQGSRFIYFSLHPGS